MNIKSTLFSLLFCSATFLPFISPSHVEAKAESCTCSDQPLLQQSVDDSITPKSGLPDPISRWYYNTGETLPRQGPYANYNLQKVVQKGDIIYDKNGAELNISGVFSVYFGHLAIVEGVYYSTTYNMYYIRVIEALQTAEQKATGESGRVMRSVFEEERLAEFETQIYRPKNATSAQIDAALNFAIGQIGKPFRSVANPPISFPSVDYNAPNWYCSELVYAAYKNAGIDLDIITVLSTFNPDIGQEIPYASYAVPSKIAKSNAVSRVYYSSHEHNFITRFFSNEQHRTHCEYCGNIYYQPHNWAPVLDTDYSQCNSCGARKYNNGLIMAPNRNPDEELS